MTTSAEIEAKRAARAAKKAAKPATKEIDFDEQPFLKREWHRFSAVAPTGLTVCTWNILAQQLIRRDLFPGADSLRWSQRSKMLNQLLFYSPTLAALQEVDRLEDHERILRPTYDFVYEKGYPAKKHGLALCWKNTYQLLRSEHVKLDELEIDPGRTALSRRTRNIGLVAALKETTSNRGVIFATLVCPPKDHEASLTIMEAPVLASTIRLRAHQTASTLPTLYTCVSITRGDKGLADLPGRRFQHSTI
jgi:RNA exonuclease NGL2